MSFDDTSIPGKVWTTHDPEAVLDYVWGFSIDEGDTIQSAEFVVPEGAAITPGALGTNTVVGWLSITGKASSPLIGSMIGVTCRYTTAGGRIDDRTLYFKIKDR